MNWGFKPDVATKTTYILFSGREIYYHLVCS